MAYVRNNYEHPDHLFSLALYAHKARGGRLACIVEGCHIWYKSIINDNGAQEWTEMYPVGEGFYKHIVNQCYCALPDPENYTGDTNFWRCPKCKAVWRTSIVQSPGYMDAKWHLAPASPPKRERTIFDEIGAGELVDI